MRRVCAFCARSDNEGDSESDNELESVGAPPVAIDVLVRAGTRAVIITGPNTGGKTAGLKVRQRCSRVTIHQRALWNEHNM